MKKNKTKSTANSSNVSKSTKPNDKNSFQKAGETTAKTDTDTSSPMVEKRWFGRGIYGSKDVPIRFLDVFITLAVVMMIVMVVWSASKGGYEISFDTGGGSEVVSQMLKYGDLVSEPETPLKPGYTLDGWVTSKDESLAEEWDFSEDTVTESMTLYAVWTPAEITVKLDPNGGSIEGSTDVAEKQVIFGETYGELPIPEREGYTFDGWLYSGEIITEDTVVTMTGEHVLTAQWAIGIG